MAGLQLDCLTMTQGAAWWSPMGLAILTEWPQNPLSPEVPDLAVPVSNLAEAGQSYWMLTVLQAGA